MQRTQTLYDTDFNLWVESQLEALRQYHYNDLDLPHLLEEIEGLTKSDKRALKSYLRILLIHLLKWQYQVEKRSNSWSNPIDNARIEIRDILADSPSLKNYLPEVFITCYLDARKQAAKETTRSLHIFPTACPYSLEQTLTEEFYPR